jgi:tetratricopeptide (TPR) repeat protein
VTEKEIANIGDGNQKLKLMMTATLGRLQMQQSEYYKAVATFDRIFEPFKEEFGECSQETIDLVYQVGLLKLTMRDFPNSLALLEQVVEKRLELCGNPKDPQILVAKHKMALLFERQEKFDQSRALFEDVYALMLEVFGESDKRTLSLMSDLVSFYDVQDEKEKAKDMYHRCYDLHKQLLGPNHQDTISVYYNLSCLYYDQEKYELALPIMEDCYQRRVIALGEGHISSLDIMHAIASLHDAIGDEGKAKGMLCKRIEIYRQFFGADTGTTLYELSEIVKWLLERKDYVTAESFALDWWQRSYRLYGESDKVTQKAWKYVVHIYKKQQKGDQTDPLLATMRPHPAVEPVTTQEEAYSLTEQDTPQSAVEPNNLTECQA